MSSPQTSSSLTVRGRGTNASTGAAGGISSVSGSGSGSLRGRSRGGPVAQLSARIAGIENRLLRQELGARANQISFTSLVDGKALEARTLLGELKMRVGTQTDGRMGVTYRNGPAPPPPTAPLVSARQLSMVIGWDGEFTPDPGSGETVERPSDLSRVDVHISTDPEFVPTAATVYASLLTESATSVFADIQDWYVRLVAVTTSDVPSVATEAVAVRPYPASQIAAGVIAAEQFAGEIFLGSTFYAGDPQSAHAEFNASGFRLTRSDGVTPTVVFSTEEGNAIITGTIQTAPPDAGVARIVFNPLPDENYNAIRFYNPAGDTWSTLAAAYGTDGSDGAVQLSGPLGATTQRSSAVLLSGRDAIVGRTYLEGGYFTDGLIVGDDIQQVAGSNITFIINYKQGDYQDLLFYWTDAITSAGHATSALEMFELFTGPPESRVHHPGWRCAGNNLSMFMDSSSLMVMDYAYQQYAHVYSLETNSSEQDKTNIEPMTPRLEGGSALSAVAGVTPSRFRRVDRSVGSVDVAVPTMSPQAVAAGQATAGERAQPVAVPSPDTEPEFGLIAEQVAAVAPEATVVDPRGNLHVRPMGVVAVLWAAVQELAGRVDELEGTRQ